MRKVRLEDDTCGDMYHDDAEIGEKVEVRLHDENGMPICKIGVLAEIFE